MDLQRYVEASGGEGRTRGGADFVAFDDWDSAELEALVGLGRREEIEAGERVLTQGDPEDRDLLIVLHGELCAYWEEAGRERALSVMRSGDLLGELSFVDSLPRSAHVRSLTPACIVRISEDDVARLTETRPELAVKFMREVARVLSHRLRRREQAF
jgi:CRP-like cAMP-binding protein